MFLHRHLYIRLWETLLVSFDIGIGAVLGRSRQYLGAASLRSQRSIERILPFTRAYTSVYRIFGSKCVQC
jgi:hypothetical protein